jgi:tRNA threonylcarbamoyladenosine biosynthesis protein TsaB
MITFALDTSSARTSVALLWDDGRCDEESFVRLTANRGAEHLLFDAIAGLLDRNKVNPGEIGLWAVGIGPGSFAGVRAGIAAAQGLALPHGRPIKTAVSFDAVVGAAVTSMPRDCLQICVLTDARRDEIYYALYDDQGRRQGEVRLGVMEDLVDQVRDPIWFVSPEIERYRDEIKSVLGGFATVADAPSYPDARVIARLARERYRVDPSSDPDPVPLYLRPVQYKTV